VIEGGVAIDLLFTDVVMPGPLRSTELAHRARALLPQLAVLFTSGYAENAIVHDGRLDEGVQLLSKPFSHNMLARRVRSALATARQLPAPQRNLSMSPPSTPESTMRSLSSLRILLCEDEELIRMLLADTLSRKGHHVVEASSARQALQSDLDAIDVLITDIGLPDGSGADLAQAVRARRPNLPVIYATGHVDHGLTLDAHSVAVIKPYGAEQLFEAIKRVLAVSASS
jgi:CheY-like chemotaxis protein